MDSKGYEKLGRTKRRMALRVVAAYRTVSNDAA